MVKNEEVQIKRNEIREKGKLNRTHPQEKLFPAHLRRTHGLSSWSWKTLKTGQGGEVNFQTNKGPAGRHNT